MPATLHPIIVTADLDRLLAFYTALLGATEVRRFPDDGPVFFVDLAFGDSELGLVSNESVVPGSAGRVSCRGVSASHPSRTPTATSST